MTDVTFELDGERIAGFLMKGHAGFAQAGEDIVCAALSAVSQTAVLGIIDVLRLDVSLKRDDERGILGLQLKDPKDEKAQVILRTLLKGLEAIDEAYPGYVRITFRDRRGKHV